jgi:hypothetical protein
MEKLQNIQIIKDIGMVEYGTKGLKHRISLCLCPLCNKEFETIHYRIKKIKSCKSCISKTHNMSKTKIYGVWVNIKARCLNKNSTYFYHYGGRGITICNEWRSDFMSFYNWAIDNGYEEGLSIDRIDVDGNYEPNNCRWETKAVQSSNIRAKGRKNNTSGCKGVSFNKERRKWSASIQYNKKSIFLGLFENKTDAMDCYNNYIKNNKLPHTESVIYTPINSIEVLQRPYSKSVASISS